MPCGGVGRIRCGLCYKGSRSSFTLNDMHMTLFWVRDWFISAQLSLRNLSLAFRRVKDRRRVLRLEIQCHNYMHFLTQFPMFCALLDVFIISFFTRVRDGYISDLVSKLRVCFGVREVNYLVYTHGGHLYWPCTGGGDTQLEVWLFQVICLGMAYTNVPSDPILLRWKLINSDLTINCKKKYHNLHPPPRIDSFIYSHKSVDIDITLNLTIPQLIYLALKVMLYHAISCYIMLYHAISHVISVSRHLLFYSDVHYYGLLQF